MKRLLIGLGLLCALATTALVAAPQAKPAAKAAASPAPKPAASPSPNPQVPPLPPGAPPPPAPPPPPTQGRRRAEGPLLDRLRARPRDRRLRPHPGGGRRGQEGLR